MRLRERETGRADYDALPNGVRFKDDILLDAVELGRVETLGGYLAKGGRGGDHEKTASGAATQGEASGGVGMGVGDDFAVLDQSYGCANYGCAQRIGDGAVHDCSRRGRRGEQGQEETGKEGGAEA